MQAGKKTLGNVFANDQQNVIPLYQRPYVWSQTRNWEPLWEDIRQAAEETELESTSDSHKHDVRTYFLGAIVLQDRKVLPVQISSQNVVDGQQRLTTLQILLASAMGVSQKLDAKSLAAKFRSLIFNQEDIIDEPYPNDRYKVWPLPQDREVFQWAVRDFGDDTTSPEPEHRISQARAWFEAEIGDWANEADSPRERLEFLHQTLKDRMEIVQIALEVSDDPQVIFEVLNHRGVPLDAADLIKNLLFQTLESQGGHKSADDLLMNSWLPLDKNPWREDVTSGRVKRKMVDLLLSYWLTIKSESEVSAEHLFADFKEWLSSTDDRASDVIRDIRHHSDQMLVMRKLPTSDATGVLLERMDATQTTTPWPLLLYLGARGEVSTCQQKIAANAIDSFLMRRGVCRMTTKDYNRLFVQVLSTARQAPPDHVGESIVEALRDQTADSRRWPSDDEFRAALLQHNLFHLVVRVRLKALLVGIENFLHTDKTELGLFKSGDSKLNIEHLLPQSWEKNWPVVGESNEDRLRQRRDAIHQLGNLTLLTTKLNPAVSNKGWAQKSKAIKQHSLMRITTGSVLTAPDSVADMSDEQWSSHWDEDRIKIRGQWLAEQAVLAWPRPKE